MKHAVEEALDLIYGPRMGFYGPPWENLEDIGASWTPYVVRALQQKEKLDGTDVCMLMIILKAVRQVRGYHRDSIVDVAGYAELVEVLNDEGMRKAFVLRAAEKIKDQRASGQHRVFERSKEDD